MIALYIILGILLLLFLILLIPVEVIAHYSDDLALTVKVLFYRLNLLPKPEKPKKTKPKKKEEPKPKPKEKKKEKPEEKKPSYLEKLKEKKGLSGVVSLLTGLAKIAGSTLKGLFSHVVIRRMDIGIALASEDAASTAVNYGRLCSVVYPAVDIIVASTVCKDYRVSLEPVFDDEKDTEISADLHAHLRLIFAVHEALKAGVKFLWLRVKI